MINKFLLTGALLLSAVPVAAQSPRVRGDLSATTCPAVAGCALVSTHGLGGAALQVTGTWVGTISFEASLDGVTFVALRATPLGGGAAVTSTTANGAWSLFTSGANQIRARMSSYTSGTATVILQGVLNGDPASVSAEQFGTWTVADSSTDPCASSAVAKVSVALAATVDAEIVALTAGQVIYICGWSATAAGTAPTYRFIYGTGAVCATGLTALTGTYLPTVGQWMTTGQGSTIAKGATANALCINVGGTSPSIQGVLTYVKQ